MLWIQLNPVERQPVAGLCAGHRAQSSLADIWLSSSLQRLKCNTAEASGWTWSHCFNLPGDTKGAKCTWEAVGFQGLCTCGQKWKTSRDRHPSIVLFNSCVRPVWPKRPRLSPCYLGFLPPQGMEPPRRAVPSSTAAQLQMQRKASSMTAKTWLSLRWGHWWEESTLKRGPFQCRVV